jgi:phosphopantothenoylcysteine decarboxylase / phosphopantothenate---cysteine ligase
VSYNPIAGKCIVLGVCGGIAAYKAADLTSRLVKAGATVEVIMTDGAQEFVAPLTFQALTHRPVVTEMFALLAETEIGHVSLAKRADVLVVAPATANTLAKLAVGLADNMLTTTALATRAPILCAPAMESAMWDSPATRVNMAALEARGVTFVGPAEGRLASGAYGIGRLSEPAEIFDAVALLLARHGDLADSRVLVTAGGTREPIDPVRFIGNHSSGKMGYALAQAARDRGAAVTLVTTPTALVPPTGVSIVPVTTAGEMAGAVLERLNQIDALIMAAAVADYRPAQAAEHKIKKEEGGEELALRLVRTIDILAEVALARGDGPSPVVVGFAAETRDLLANAGAKLARKRLDLIAANDVSAPDSGFGADTNRVTLLFPDGRVEPLPLLSKLDVAHEILTRVVALLAGIPVSLLPPADAD